MAATLVTVVAVVSGSSRRRGADGSSSSSASCSSSDTGGLICLPGRCHRHCLSSVTAVCAALVASAGGSNWSGMWGPRTLTKILNQVSEQLSELYLSSIPDNLRLTFGNTGII